MRNFLDNETWDFSATWSEPRSKLNPFYAEFPFTAIIVCFCIWSKSTDVSCKMTSNIFQHFIWKSQIWHIPLELLRWRLVGTPFHFTKTPICVCVCTRARVCVCAMGTWGLKILNWVISLLILLYELCVTPWLKLSHFICHTILTDAGF